MNANFWLKKDHSRKLNAIRLQCSFDGYLLRYSSGISVELNQWSESKQKIHSGVKDSETLNRYLSELRQAAIDEYFEYKRIHKKTFTPEYLKQFLDNNIKSGKTKPEFIEDYFVEYINDKDKRVSDRTMATYKTFYSHLLALQQHYKIKIAYTDLNQDFYNKLVDYFVFIKKHENRTIKDKHLSAFASFLNWSVSKDYIVKNPYSSIKFPYKINPADTVSLSEIELNKLLNLELTNERLDRIRDAFCLECFCGLRHSDMDKIKTENLKGNHLEIFTHKTADRLYIPLRPEALKIIHKYFNRGEAFPSISNQKSNDYIKELCEIAEINEPISILKISGLKRLTEIYKKYELVSTHTARRTFVTLSYQRGVNALDIMAITGHKDLKTFQKYHRLDKAQVSENFLNAHSNLKTAYSIPEIVSNLMKLQVDKKIIAEALGIEIESIE